MRLAYVFFMLSVGCAAGGDDSTSDAGAPLVGIDGSLDQADRNCHVVLRELARVRDGFGGYQTSGESWIWEGFVDISAAAGSEGLAPAILYHYGSDPAWRLGDAEPSDLPAPAGFVRWRVRMDEALPGPGLSGTALGQARVDVVPYLGLDAGGRLFDHNRHAGDFDNHVLNWDGDFQIRRDDAVCPAVGDPPPARLVFAADWSETQIGGIAPGRELRVEYDVARLPQCRHWRNGYELWDITAHLRWEPSGQMAAASVRAGAAAFTVPAGARRAVLWFENTSAIGCQAWDSNLGANYAFDVLAPPAWVGNALVRITRDTDDTCAGTGGVPLAGGFHFDTWARQRAAITNACLQVWEPGVTDHDDPELWRKLDVAIHWRGAGTNTPFRVEPVWFDRRVGNDARFAFNLRGIDPFRPYHCPDVPTYEEAGYLHAALELHFMVNGVELRPDDGGEFGGTFTDYLSNPYRDEHCP